MHKRIKTILSPQASEYGSTCLAMLLSWYGIQVSLFRASQACLITRDGSTFEQLKNGAATLGVPAEIKEADLSTLRSRKEPCIVTLDQEYAVLERLTENGAVIDSPGQGRVKMSLDAFTKACGNEALFLQPDASGSREQGKKTSAVRYALGLLSGKQVKDVVFYMLVLLGVCLLLVMIPKITSMITDFLFPEGASESITGLPMALFGLVLLLLLLTCFEMLSVPLFARFSERVSTNCRTSFLWSALNLPMDFYQIRTDGYFMESSGQVLELGYFLSKQIVDVLLRPLLALVLLVMMATVSVPCMLVVAASVVVMGISCALSARFVDQKGRAVFNRQCKESGFLMEGLKAIRSIRNSGSEFIFFRDYVRLNRESSKDLKPFKGMRNVFSILPGSVSNLTKLVLILVGVICIYRGKLSYGGLIYVHGVCCIVQGYIRTAITSGQSLMSMKYKLENMQEICNAKEEEDTGRTAITEGAEYEKLKGQISIRNLSFGYNRFADRILKDINMEIPAGSSVAIVGASGSGKTTLKKLICGRYEPWEGQILYDGKNGKDVPVPVLANSIASVDQQIILFGDSVMNNIKMWDATQLNADAILAARDSEIHEEIILREGGYKSPITEDGGNYSGGQRQRIEIARALSMDPTILVMDEATSALDTVVEKRIVEHVRNRGITTIVVAHRLSTIRNCDCIYVMDQGRIVDRGTHEELMQSCGLYRNLVTLE